jgi:hypothetical protein
MASGNDAPQALIFWALAIDAPAASNTPHASSTLFILLFLQFSQTIVTVLLQFREIRMRYFMAGAAPGSV